jgi:hypothetical protein
MLEQTISRIASIHLFLQKPDAVLIEYPEVGISAIKYTSRKGHPSLATFTKRSPKPIAHYAYRNSLMRDDALDRIISDALEAKEELARLKKERAEWQHGLKVGDIMVASWGYDQTNVNFYQVVEVAGKNVSIREVASQTVRQDRGVNHVMPIPNRFVSTPMKNKRPHKGYKGEPSVKIHESANAYPWDGKPKMETAAGFGH